MTETKKTAPTIREMVCALRDMPLGKRREALDLIAEIERADRAEERHRKAQAARATARAKAFETLRGVLSSTVDYVGADAIVTRLETSFAPAFVPPPAGNVVVHHRRRFSF